MSMWLCSTPHQKSVQGVSQRDRTVYFHQCFERVQLVLVVRPVSVCVRKPVGKEVRAIVVQLVGTEGG